LPSFIPTAARKLSYLVAASGKAVATSTYKHSPLHLLILVVLAIIVHLLAKLCAPATMVLVLRLAPASQHCALQLARLRSTKKIRWSGHSLRHHGPIRRRHAIVLKLRPKEGQLPGTDSVPSASSRVNDQETSNVILDDPFLSALLSSQNQGPTSSVKTMTEEALS